MIRRMLRRFFQTHRRRLASLVLIVGLVWIGTKVAHVFPRDVHIEYQLSPHQVIDSVEITYLHRGEEVVAVRFDHPPHRFVHTVSLSPGRYRIEAIRTQAGQREIIDRAFRVPVEGTLHIDLVQ